MGGVGGVGGWCGVGLGSNNHVKPNPRLRLVELWLGWGYDNLLPD